MMDEVVDEGPGESVDLAEEVIEETVADADAEAEDAEADDRADWSEIEVDGQVWLAPPALKSAFLRQADYTRKTQELAERRREAQAEHEAAGAHIAGRARLHLLDEQAQALD